jgi:hypothetical protein
MKRCAHLAIVYEDECLNVGVCRTRVQRCWPAADKQGKTPRPSGASRTLITFINDKKMSHLLLVDILGSLGRDLQAFQPFR